MMTHQIPNKLINDLSENKITVYQLSHKLVYKMSKIIDNCCFINIVIKYSCVMVQQNEVDSTFHMTGPRMKIQPFNGSLYIEYTSMLSYGRRRGIMGWICKLGL